MRPSAVRHFLSLSDISCAEGLFLLNRAIELKAMQANHEIHHPLKNKILTMIFEKSSTRTRLSFEVGMLQLGGESVYLSTKDSQLGRGEPFSDTARVVSGMTDGILMRCASQSDMKDLAKDSSVPVINGLTEAYHPCQILADLQTLKEHFGQIEGLTITWLGDFNNMCMTYIQATQLFDFKLRICVPECFHAQIQSHPNISCFSDPVEAVQATNVVMTDVWASMGQEDEQEERLQMFAPYAVTASLMKQAHAQAVFLHCLPAHRGEEVESAVIDGPTSLVWQQANNRLHSQKALLEWLL